MFHKLIHRILVRRHFWRHASFSEISELYASRMLRMLALNIAASFMSIFLFQHGYGIPFIAFFWGIFFLYKSLAAIPLAAISARIGAKHGILLSNLLFIPSMIAFALVPEYGPWLLAIVVLFQGASSSLYSISYSTDFSKVKSIDHAGKEIAYMNIIEKITTSVSPLIGGVIAYLLGPQFVLVVAALLFALAAVPLLRSGEQVQTGKKLVFKGFPWRLIFQHWVAQLAVGYDVFASGTIWTLYTAVIVIGVGSGNEVYAATGALMSVVLIATLISSYVYGRIIDKKGGKVLMRAGVVANALTHLMRPFITSPIMVAGANVANEVATTGYTMPYTRAVFDNADLSGHRATYLGMVDVLSNFGAFLAAGTLGLLVMLTEGTVGLTNFFFVTGIVALLVLTARFSLYKK